MCLRWTTTERFDAHGAMACPSDRSRAPFITPGARSARSSPSPSPIPTHGPTTGPHRSWGHSTRSSTRSWPTTSTPRPSNATPPCRCSAASATSMATPAVTARCNATRGGTEFDIKKPSSLRDTSPDAASRPIPAASTSTSPTADASSPSASPPGPTPTPPSSWRCRSSAPRRSFTAWSPRSTPSGASPGKSGGTIQRLLQR
jgi:hypothetical protein